MVLRAGTTSRDARQQAVVGMRAVEQNSFESEALGVSADCAEDAACLHQPATGVARSHWITKAPYLRSSLDACSGTSAGASGKPMAAQTKGNFRRKQRHDGCAAAEVSPWGLDAGDACRHPPSTAVAWRRECGWQASRSRVPAVQPSPQSAKAGCHVLRAACRPRCLSTRPRTESEVAPHDRSRKNIVRKRKKAARRRPFRLTMDLPKQAVDQKLWRTPMAPAVESRLSTAPKLLPLSVPPGMDNCERPLFCRRPMSAYTAVRFDRL